MLPDEHISNKVLFISHTAADRPYALALERAIHQLVDSDSVIEVRYSTSAEAGPQGGDRWRQWIERQVVEARTALIVVTPESVSKPWLMWEAGACSGASLARRQYPTTTAESGKREPRMLVSIAYGIAENECPDPLRGDQIVLGLDRERMKQLLTQVLRNYHLTESQLLKVGERLQAVVSEYLDAARTALLRSPSLVTEANVQDWLSRLEELVEREDRRSELKGFQRWMNLAFGREGETARVPIDVRLHRRLGELSLAQRDYDMAAEQLELARRAAPRDIYVLRPLGEVQVKRYLRGADSNEQNAALRKDIADLLDAIQDLDEDAFVSNPDAAALYGKYYRRALGDPQKAMTIFKTALERNPDSYYLADVLGQTQLESGLNDEAISSFKQTIQILDRLEEQNIWTHATYATAYLVLGKREQVTKHLEALADFAPTGSVVDSVSGGLREVATRLGLQHSEVDRMLACLSQRPSSNKNP